MGLALASRLIQRFDVLVCEKGGRGAVVGCVHVCVCSSFTVLRRKEGSEKDAGGMDQ